MKKVDTTKSFIDIQASPTDCPFREFRDNELSVDYWGLGPIEFKSVMRLGKGVSKSQNDQFWVDNQIQPLPRSARKRLHGWVRAEELAQSQWEAEVTVFEDNNEGMMSTADIQLAHYQVLQMSSFCRRVLSICYILERAEDFTVEHQWENFIFNMPPEGWRARYHIYSPGLKHGGGQQHRPTLSKNGCYLVRLYYIGAWRCVWVSDQVPVDAAGSPLLPFAPCLNKNASKTIGKPTTGAVTDPSVYLWQLLICKALLKLAAPGMDSDNDSNFSEDESMQDIDIMHALTGSMNLTYHFKDADQLWKLITSEVPHFLWDDDDETLASTIRPKTKKPNTKETSVFKHRSLTSIFIQNTKNLPAYTLPGITPAFEMHLLVNMARDLPLKKPLPEPDVSLWKSYRWIDWARKHGLYEAFDCPRTRFLKMNALLKLSQAPHLLDVQSTDSITFGFREEHGRTNPGIRKGTGREANRSVTPDPTITPQLKEELREWVQFDAIMKLMKSISVLYYPSMYQFCSIASNPPMRITKVTTNKELDIPASKTSPLYVQIDGPEDSNLKISCGMLHPRVFLHVGLPIGDYVEPGYVLLEKFEWFTDCELPKPTQFMQTRGYDAMEVTFSPGRHFCRLWIHSRVPWHVMLLSDSTIHVGTRDIIQMAAVRECPWASRFLNTLGGAIHNLLRTNKSNISVISADRDFYRSYQPDLFWSTEEVGFSKSYLHWMFRQALQSILKKRLMPLDYQQTCTVLQNYLYDPEFGLSKDVLSFVSIKNFTTNESCDCSMLEAEELEIFKLQYIDTMIEYKLTSRICDNATEDMSCGHLKTIRDILLRRHEAAIRIQALWRGFKTRKCMESRAVISPEIMKCLMDNAFGNLEALSALMNEFFSIFPGAKSAYSLSSALAGTYGLKQHCGITRITPQCVWIPFFQGVFYCHAPVKVHLDLKSTSGMNKIHSTFEVYNNDTKKQLPQAFTTHFTLNFRPNRNGYTILGHGTLKQALNFGSDVHWQLNLMSSTVNLFHICDNDIDGCKELTLPSAMKLHIDEIYIPNQRNIIGGIQISVTNEETICFRASATFSELEMEAVLLTRGNDGKLHELSKCTGKGDLYWPYIRIEPTKKILDRKSYSQANLIMPQSESAIPGLRSQRTVKHGKSLTAGIKTRSTVKIRDQRLTQEQKVYTIEVRATNGWALSIAQWKRVIEIQNNQDYKSDIHMKKSFKDKFDKTMAFKDKENFDSSTCNQPQPGDAYVELECSLSGETDANANRDDSRDLEFIAAAKSWEAKDPKRNAKGALIRKAFRDEFLEIPRKSDLENIEEMSEVSIKEDNLEHNHLSRQGPTPATQSSVAREKAKNQGAEPQTVVQYLTMPEELKDTFKPLDFVPLCTRERTEDENTIVTPEMAEASKRSREARIEAAIERMNQLQNYNDVHVLGMQKIQCDLLEKLFVDSLWSPGLSEALEARDNALVTEVLNKNASLTRKKPDSKSK